MRLNRHANPAYLEQFQQAEERFNLLFNDSDAFYALVAAGLKFMDASHAEAKLNLLRSNFFSEELLQAMICAGQSYKMAPVHYIWQRLAEREIVMRATGYMPGALADHHLVLPLLLEHLRAHTFANLFAPPSALIERYAHAIVAIDVRTRSGTSSRGTGFLGIAADGRAPRIYTCKHNVDPEAAIEIVAVTAADGTVLNYGLPHCHPTEDLAVLPLAGVDRPEPLFRFRDKVEVFDEVYTLGYPLVPCAETAVVGHRGEVNGVANLYLGGSSILLISNLVSPGNSGGPLLDRDGFCVGMSIKWLEGEWDGERARFSAALPASLVREPFLKRAMCGGRRRRAKII